MDLSSALANAYSGRDLREEQCIEMRFVVSEIRAKGLARKGPLAESTSEPLNGIRPTFGFVGAMPVVELRLGLRVTGALAIRTASGFKHVEFTSMEGFEALAMEMDRRKSFWFHKLRGKIEDAFTTQASQFSKFQTLPVSIIEGGDPEPGLGLPRSGSYSADPIAAEGLGFPSSCLSPGWRRPIPFSARELPHDPIEDSAPHHPLARDRRRACLGFDGLGGRRSR